MNPEAILSLEPMGAPGLAKAVVDRASLRASRDRAEGFRAAYLLIAIGAIAALAAIGISRIVPDILVCVAAAGLVMLMLIALLEAFGLLQSR